MKTEFKLAQKAFAVGEEDAVFRFRMHSHISPDDHIRIITAKTAGQAKSIFSSEEYMDFLSVNCVRAKSYDLYFFEGKKITLEDIQRELEYRQWKSNMISLVENNPKSKVHIYSGQWGSYWRSNSVGYTHKKENAGIYDINEAWNCVSHCGLEKRIEFRFVS